MIAAMRTSSSWGSSCWSIGWVVSLLLLQVAGQAQSSPKNYNNTATSVELFVPHIHDHSVVKVTYDNRWTDGSRTHFLQCCKWAWPQNTSVEITRSRNLNCSILGGDGGLDDQGKRIVPAGDFCLRVRSSSSSSCIVGGGNAARGCALRVDATVSLSLYLASRSSSVWPASVQTRAECLRDNAPCRLTITDTISGKLLPESKVRSLSGVLGVVEWTGGLSSDNRDARRQSQAAYYDVAVSRRENDPRKLHSPRMVDFALSISPLVDQARRMDAFEFKGRRVLRQSGVAKVAGFRWRVFVVAAAGMLMSLAGISVVAILCAGKKGDESPSEFLDTVTILPPRFSYSKLQKATKNYYQKLGDGAFGSVYEGTLPNGIRVAVKMLEKASVQGEKQFRAEVASMGAIRHLNLVRLHGFCSEGSHRLLVYEYMPNGSLDSWLFGKKQGEKLLDWEQRLNIALGTARGLAYLHEECSDHIIHLDVKPENILLDHQFCPKLSDFGLAKLMDREQSRVVTSMRGTPGYLAPEWLLPQAAVTAKTDVYSFGMVLLELISGRENTNFSLGKEQWYFPAWAFKLMSEGRTMELLDKRLHVEEVEYFHKEDAMRAIHVALLCIQDDPAARPSMSRVVHMLQGHIEPEPLNAQQSAINPPRRLVTAFAASGIDTKPNKDHQNSNLNKDHQNSNLNKDHQNSNTNKDHQNSNTNKDHQNSDPNSDLRRDSRSDPRSDVRRDSKDSKSSREDSRKNSWSNEHDPILTELQKDMRNDYYHRMTPAATTPVIPSRLPAVTESPRVLESPNLRSNLHPRPETEMDNFKLEPALPAAVQGVSQYRSSHETRLPGAHTLGSNHKCIPPWPVQGDVILLRGAQGDFHGVVRDVRVQTKLMRLGLLHRQSSETRWSVREEESVWRNWTESIRTLDFWVAVRWAVIPGRGIEKFPVEWHVR